MLAQRQQADAAAAATQDAAIAGELAGEPAPAAPVDRVELAVHCVEAMRLTDNLSERVRAGAAACSAHPAPQSVTTLLALLREFGDIGDRLPLSSRDVTASTAGTRFAELHALCACGRRTARAGGAVNCQYCGASLADAEDLVYNRIKPQLQQMWNGPVGSVRCASAALNSRASS